MISAGACMATTDGTKQRIFICDAGPIIHLDELDCLFLLHDLGIPVIPPAVQSEVERHRPAAFASGTINFTTHPVVIPLQISALARPMNLHSGELEALALAIAEDAAMLLTDDTAARFAAILLGIPVHGTIGVILRGVRTKRLTRKDAWQILSDIPAKSTLHIRKQLLDEVLREVSEYSP